MHSIVIMRSRRDVYGCNARMFARTSLITIKSECICINKNNHESSTSTATYMKAKKHTRSIALIKTIILHVQTSPEDTHPWCFRLQAVTPCSIKVFKYSLSCATELIYKLRTINPIDGP